MTQREQYIKTWHDYTNELYSVAFDLAKIGELNQSKELQARIEAIKSEIIITANKLYPRGKNKVILDSK